jgi:cyclopropane fatty-acyl-phospholipid synthase-like methyltransferase
MKTILDQLSQDPIDLLSGGYRYSQILFTANRLRIFEILGKRTVSLEELAGETGASRRGLRILCDALTTLTLLEKSEQGYRNSDLALAGLLPGAPRSRAAILLHGAELYERWGGLYDAVKTGNPVPRERVDPRLQGDERRFAEAMADSARAIAGQTADSVDLSNATRLLDVGGGPGVYAVEFVRRNPSLKVTILDDENTLQVAKQKIEESGLAESITLQAGDAFEASLAAHYDFIFLSNLVHAYSNDSNRRLVTRLAGSLVPGGLMCIKDFLLEPDRTAPPWAAVFAVNMLVNSEEGDCYTVDEVKQWFQAAGLRFENLVELTPQTRLALARKPA